MKLYLVRHGNAMGGANDIVRPLSSEGIAEVKQVAEFLKVQNCQVDIVYHSIRLRARQTAEILHGCLKVKKDLMERSDLSPNDAIDEIADFIDQQKTDLMIVGHQPFMGSLVSLLVSGEEHRNLVAFSTGAVAILERKQNGPWLIAAMIDPKNL
jgi:phosphohistidine phosphatase